ncbi:hypothetical protein [Microbacterium sp. NPDC087589]|uniref:hypothetical protein n=1 Tax=Microbacterium sp. NPDC087589 TaxID=3364191 RepID=UPI0037F93130
MNCAADPIACKLDEIARALQGSEWSSFWPTLLATLVGAAVAGLVSIALYRHERKRRNRSEVDVAVAELIREVQAYSHAYQGFLQYMSNWSQAEMKRLAVGGPATGYSHPGVPAREGIDTAVEMLVVLTTGEDRLVAERTRQVLYELNFLEDYEKQRPEYYAIRRVLVAWRAQKRTAEETLTSLDVVDRRRELIESGNDENLPPSPEPYSRAMSV